MTRTTDASDPDAGALAHPESAAPRSSAKTAHRASDRGVARNGRAIIGARDRS
jgi:hypothetical protein